MKDYSKPILIEEEVEIEDVIASSGAGSIGGHQHGDSEGTWPFN